MPGSPFPVIKVRATEAIRSALQHLLRVPSVASTLSGVDARELAEQIYTAMLGPSCWRPRKFTPTVLNRESTIASIERFVRLGLPIDCVSMGAAAKHYCLGSQAAPDLAELLWVQRYQGIQQAVQCLYAPGINVDVFLEDWGEHFLCDQKCPVQERIDTFVEGLDSLARHLGGSWLRFLPESEVFSTRETPWQLLEALGICAVRETIDRALFAQVCEHFADLFLAYLRETEREGLVPQSSCECSHEHDLLLSTRALEAAGFTGGVPQQQRDHYLCRASNSCGEELCGDAGLVHIARYLGTVQGRARLQIIRPKTSDDAGSIPPVKLSFMGQAPGSPLHLQRHRIEYVAHPRSKRSGNKTPSWAGWGTIRLDKGTHRAGISPLHEVPSEAPRESFELLSDDSAIELVATMLT
jgi:hypothetical protein